MAESTIEEILAYIGITHDNVRQDAYNHWKRFIEFIRNRTPANWKDDLRPKLRSYIGVDFRYIDDYYECCLSWEIMISNNGMVEFIGLPEGIEKPTELTKEQLKEELDEENSNRIALGKKPFTLEQWRKIRKPRMKVQ